jgi:hypothetical protein
MLSPLSVRMISTIPASSPAPRSGRIDPDGRPPSALAGLPLRRRASFRDDVGPEIDSRALVPQAHRKRFAAPVPDRPLAPLESIWASLETLVYAIGGELRLVDRELPLGQTKSGLVGRQVGEEELKEPRIANLRRRTRRSIEPGAER